MKERLKQIVQKILQASKDRIASTIATAIQTVKTPQGRKKIYIGVACILLIGISFFGYNSSKKRQAPYVVEAINIALKKNDLRGLTKYFDIPSIIGDFVQHIVPLQAYFVYDTKAHKPVEVEVFKGLADRLLMQVALASIKSRNAPTDEDSATEAPKKTPPKVANRLVEPYTSFQMPLLFPVEIIKLLAESSFTLLAQEDDIAIIRIEFTHPTLGIQIPLKFLMEKGLTSWSITRLSNASHVLKQIASAVRDRKNAAITAFQVANRRVEEVFDLHFNTVLCTAIVGQDPQRGDATIIVDATITNKGQISIRAASINLALFTQEGHYLGSMPVNFAKKLPAGSTKQQSWRREVASARQNSPLLYDATGLRCSIKPSRILFEDGQNITFLPEKLLDGL